MRIRTITAALAAVALALGGTALPAAAAPDRHRSDGPERVVVYYQTQYTDDHYVSPLPLVTKHTGLTDLVVGAIHLNEDPKALTLNDDPPSADRYDPMWRDLHRMQRSGVKVIGMLGGAAPGTYDRLDDDFGTYYPALKKMVRQYRLDGLDLDVEQPMSQHGINRLIDRLRSDFGKRFIITLTPVATALAGGESLSGFSYDVLERQRGRQIDWYNTQFYCGWGSLESTEDYDAIVAHGTVKPSRIVAGTLTDPSLCGSGYVPIGTLQKTIRQLDREHRDFGGVFGWEYFTSQPGGKAAPWRWAGLVRDAMRG